MRKINIDVPGIFKRVRKLSPLVHHLTNWVTIFDCAQAVKAVGASPVMAHAPEEAADMTRLSSSLVLNIGTLTSLFVQAAVAAGSAANAKKIPVVFDPCGVGATRFRNESAAKLLRKVQMAVIKGNASEIARLSGKKVITKGVDSSSVEGMYRIAKEFALAHSCVVAVTGKEDVITDGVRSYCIRNGHPIMGEVVGTGCMVASLIGACVGVESDYLLAAVSALVYFECAAEKAASCAHGPGTFREKLFDFLAHTPARTLSIRQNVYLV